MNYLVNSSLNKGIPIQIIYQNKSSVFSKRPIIVKAVNDSYIKAFCLTKRQMRIFKIDSILAVSQMNTIREERHFA